MYTEDYEDIDEGTIIHRKIVNDETLYSTFPEETNSSQINETISRYASDYIKQWKPKIVI